MRLALALSLSALVLTGCAKNYDQAAVPGATVALHISSEACQARHAANTLKSWSEWEACELAAERAFALAIHMKRMDAFDAYAANMQALAAERDANRITAQQVAVQADLIRGRFMTECGCKPKTAYREPANFMPPERAPASDLNMGQGGHAMGPGPGNFP